MNFSLRDSSVLYLVPPTSSANALTARDVSFDPAPSDFVSSNVQDVVDELASRPMRIDRLGLAFGLQDIPNISDGYGHLCNPGPASLTIYSPNGTDVPQAMNMANSTVIVNNVSDDSGCTVDETLLIANGAIIQGVDLRRAVLLVNKVQNMGNEFAGSLVAGSFVDFNLHRAPGSVIMAADSQSGTLVDVDGKFCGYIGNGRQPVTVNDEQFYISQFNDFYLQTLANAPQTYTLQYDPGSGRVTYDVPIAPVPQLKQALAPGSTYGFVNHVGNTVEITGRNSMPLYQVTNAAVIHRATVVGSNIFTNASGGSYQSTTTIGSDLTIAPAADISNSVIIANQFSNTTVQGINNCIIVAPKAGGITAPPASNVPLTNSVVLCPNNVTFTASSGGGPVVSNTLAVCTGNVALGSQNVIIARNASLLDAQQQNVNGGHIIIANLPTANPYTIGLAAQARANILLLVEDASPLPVPTQDSSLVSNVRNAFISLSPNQMLSVFNNTEADLIRPVMFNTDTKRMAPMLRSPIGGGMAPLQYNFKVVAQASAGTRLAVLSIPFELRGAALIGKVGVTCSTTNPGGTANTNTVFTAQYMGILGTNMRFQAYEQAVGLTPAPLTHATQDVVIDVVLSY